MKNNLNVKNELKMSKKLKTYNKQIQIKEIYKNLEKIDENLDKILLLFKNEDII